MSGLDSVVSGWIIFLLAIVTLLLLALSSSVLPCSTVGTVWVDSWGLTIDGAAISGVGAGVFCAKSFIASANTASSFFVAASASDVGGTVGCGLVLVSLGVGLVTKSLICSPTVAFSSAVVAVLSDALSGFGAEGSGAGGSGATGVGADTTGSGGTTGMGGAVSGVTGGTGAGVGSAGVVNGVGAAGGDAGWVDCSCG